MIGVAVPSTEQESVQEFFELFKTPWESSRPGRQYSVVLTTESEFQSDTAKLLIVACAGTTAVDRQNNIAVKTAAKGATLLYSEKRIPIYGDLAVFPNNAFSIARESETLAPVSFLCSATSRNTVRLGFNIFEEARKLLTTGQPESKANVATLDWHIALLRELILRCGGSLVEIPPVPDGFKFTACLTHDLDHPSLRNHCCDHTMFGFLYRATVGSLVQACQGRKPVAKMCRNWAAASRLPLVYFGMAKDPWGGFDSYLDIEAGMGSTYFVIPKKGYAGRRTEGVAPANRASGYNVQDIQPQLQKLMSAGCEVSLHGLDAWLDSDSGTAERQELTRALGTHENGVRMHWLFFNEQSPAVLDRAGFSYDSSFGYNQTVGFRAGTAQAYKPAGATNLLELPLHVMDTALFYPYYLNLSEEGAEKVVRPLVDEVEKLGGALTINWHDRSIAPERQWDGFYLNLLAELKKRRAWFPTASQAVAWFRRRRAVTFSESQNGNVQLQDSPQESSKLPGLRVRVHKPDGTTDVTLNGGSVLIEL